MKNEKFYKFIIRGKTKKNLSSLSSHFSSQKGFTLVEFLLIMSIFAVLSAIATVNLFSFQHQSQLNSALNTFMADIKQQQIKAMAGDAAGTTTVENYGINFDSTNYQYILFKGTYSATNSANFAVGYNNTIQLTTTFPNSQLVFVKGSGEISGYASTSATITLRDTMNNDQRILLLNKYGVVTSITR